MPSRGEQALSASASLRRLQRRLPELSVPALLRLRDAVESVLARDRLQPDDLDAVHAAVDNAG